MYYVPRGGNRGGADQFTWDSVKSDKDRECYLGHSLKAPVGRWQQGKDLQWFNKERKEGVDSSNMTEAEAVKQAEKEALVIALGQKIPSRLQPNPKPHQQKRSPSPHTASTSSPPAWNRKKKRARTEGIDAVLLQKLKKRHNSADGPYEGKHLHFNRGERKRKQKMKESKKKKKKKECHHSSSDRERAEYGTSNKGGQRIKKLCHGMNDRKKKK
ncbi:uncharacterized protein [Diadema antillarum]|uniref:uncharacterized protein n=2 Tax=Diadema antillarum TaxID=105358 RepID=UPI003A87D2C8